MTSPSLQLFDVISANDFSQIKKLVKEEKINVNDKGSLISPPLHIAASQGKAEAVRTLLELGADKNAKDDQGQTALELAKKYNHSVIVEILLQN
jgi:ankyrin repeat protein